MKWNRNLSIWILLQLYLLCLVRNWKTITTCLMMIVVVFLGSSELWVCVASSGIASSAGITVLVKSGTSERGEKRGEASSSIKEKCMHTGKHILLNNLMIGHGDMYPNYLLKGSVYFDKNHDWASWVNVAYRPWKIMLSFISIFFSDVILICKHS